MLKKYPASEFIKDAMEIKGWNNEDLARNSGVNSKTISLLLSNKTPFTIKMDRLIGPSLGFPVGTLSKIEAIYLDWYNLQTENWKHIDIGLFNWNFRKHKNANLERTKKTIILAERKIREEETYYINKSMKNFFFNDYLKIVCSIKDNKSFTESMKQLVESGINIFLFDGVNIRGMSKLNNDENKIYIFINKKLNKNIYSFITTLTHEIIHYIDLDSLPSHDNESEHKEKEIDLLAINYLLKDQMKFLEQQMKENNLDNLSIEVIKEYSSQLEINWIYFYGLFTYIFNKYEEAHQCDELLINFEEEMWSNKNI